MGMEAGASAALSALAAVSPPLAGALVAGLIQFRGAEPTFYFMLGLLMAEPLVKSAGRKVEETAASSDWQISGG